MANQRAGNDRRGNGVRVNDGVKDHFVRPTSATSIPQHLVFVDCESESRPDPNGPGQLQSFRLGVAVAVRRMQGQWERRQVLRFTDTLEFWEWLIPRVNPKQPLWIFSHNLSVDSTWLDVWARVDDGTLRLNVPCRTCGQFLKGECKDHHPFRGAAVVSDPPIILCFKCRNGVIRMVDTLNYWQTSLYKLGLSVGLPKLEKPVDEKADRDWFPYCERDCEILERIVCQLLDEWERDQCGHFASTAAGCAWAAFRKTIDPKRILIDHGEPHTAMERAAYYGGQTECYYLGNVDEAVYLLDVRSLYPGVMARSPFPVKFTHIERDAKPEKVLKSLQFSCAVAHVRIRTENAGYPLRIKGGLQRDGFTVKTTPAGRLKVDADRLAFPVGDYYTCLAGPELQRALLRGEVAELPAVAWYEPGRIFEKFVDTWFAKRPAEVTPETYARDLLCKTVLNSMSGYFAKHKMRWKDRPGAIAACVWGEWWGKHVQVGQTVKFRAIGGQVQELEAEGESRDSFPGISAYITAYGREQMLFLRELCPERSVLYQDTDSLIVTDAGYAALDKVNLIGTGQLGRLRYVDTLHGLKISGVKDYEHCKERVAAGVKRKAVKLRPGVFRQEAWESLAEQWSRTPDGTVRVREIVVSLSRTRLPREPGPDGWTLAPKIHSAELVPF